MTKDNIHIVWKTSRLGEEAQIAHGIDTENKLIRKYGFNSPFEEFAIAYDLTNKGIPTIYVRAIYMTGTTKNELAADPRHYAAHSHKLAIDNEPILRERHDYIILRGYFNGPDSWVASHEGQLCTPFDLERAWREGILNQEDCSRLLDITRSRLKNVGYDSTFLELNDIIIAIDPQGNILTDKEQHPETRICNFELIHKL